MSGSAAPVELSASEYIALTVLRGCVKAVNRVCASSQSFRSPFVRRLVTQAVNVLQECVREIESYDPEMVERELRARDSQEPDVGCAAESEHRDATLMLARELR